MTKVGIVEAEWSGGYPCLCSGKWTLKVNEKNVSRKIPKDLRNSPMQTFGSYEQWYFGDDGEEVFESYEDGLNCDDWMKQNGYWLKKITADEEVWKCIFQAVNAEDFRTGSCGGCI